jgi:hypothetical protein
MRDVDVLESFIVNAAEEILFFVARARLLRCDWALFRKGWRGRAPCEVAVATWVIERSQLPLLLLRDDRVVGMLRPA